MTAPGAQILMTMRGSGDFSEREIRDWELGTRRKLYHGGMTNEEITAYFGQIPFDQSPIHKALRAGIEEVGLRGETMPEKATRFYPKVSTGFVFYQLV